MPYFVKKLRNCYVIYIYIYIYIYICIIVHLKFHTMKKLLKSLLVVLCFISFTSLTYADVIIKGPNGTYDEFPNMCCKDFGVLPSDHTCYETEDCHS